MLPSSNFTFSESVAHGLLVKAETITTTTGSTKQENQTVVDNLNCVANAILGTEVPPGQVGLHRTESTSRPNSASMYAEEAEASTISFLETKTSVSSKPNSVDGRNSTGSWTSITSTTKFTGNVTGGNDSDIELQWPQPKSKLENVGAFFRRLWNRVANLKIRRLMTRRKSKRPVRRSASLRSRRSGVQNPTKTLCSACKYTVSEHVKAVHSLRRLPLIELRRNSNSTVTKPKKPYRKRIRRLNVIL